jgi:copper chaperone NosL
MTAPLSFRGTPTGRVPRNPPDRRTPRRPAGPKLLGVTSAGPVLLGLTTGITLAFFSCGGGAPEPAALDTRNEACASCRMAVSTAVFASQLVAPGELPRFFDDLGCLGDFLQAGKAPARATAFVADHRTKAWVRADHAVYTRVPGLETPMGSHVIAHADAASRDQDPVALGGSPVTPAELFGPAGPPPGGPR